MSKSSRYLNTAQQALTVAYAVKKLINVEYHSLITDFTVGPSTSGAVVNLSAVAQGDDLANRQGNKIRAKYLALSGTVEINASATASTLRMMIVRDNNGSTAQPTIPTLFTDVGTFSVGKQKLGDPQTNSRFSILWDKYLLLDAVNSSQHHVSYSISLDHHQFFSGTGATDEGKGALYLFIASNEATNVPAVAIDSMFKFIDN